jgi:hypothetical protein
MFNDYAFDDIGDVFAAIDGGLEFFVHVLPLENFQRIAPVMKQCGHRAVINVVPLVLETMKFNQPLGYSLRLGRIETTSFSCRAMR